MAEKEKKQHFILVHGACHGAWCWYKLKPLLEAASHRVTVLDMAASGIDRRAVEEVRTLSEYSKPLLEMMDGIIGGGEEKVILVGHSLGGLTLALAMETHPDKIAAAVFLTAYLPDTRHPPSYVLDMHSEKNPMEDLLDVKFCSSNGNTTTSILFGPKFLSSYLYHLSPIEDLELAKTLVRPSSLLFQENLSKGKKFSEDKFGGVRKVYVICSEDKIIRKQYQEWMIQNSGNIQYVMEIEGADHMPMFSKPQQLSQCLLHIAKKYAY